MNVTLWGRPMELVGGPYAIWVYRKEFGGDLAADLSASTEGGEIQLSIWLQIVWAMNRTGDDECPGYGEWLAGFPDFDLGDQDALGVMDSAIAAGFFRAGPSGKARRRLARCLGAMARALARAQARLIARRP